MAEFFTNYPQAQKPMSLGDMLNIASGVQNYQQAQQLNPLQLQKAQMEIEQAKQVNPLKVRQEQAATQGAEFDLDQKQNEGLYRLAGSILNDKRLESNDPKKVVEAINSAKQGADSLRIPKQYVDKAFQPLLDQAETSPSLVKHSIANLVQRGLTAAQQQSLQTPQLTTNAAGQLVSANPYSNKVQVLGGNGGQGVGGQTVNPNFPTEANPTGFSIGATKEQSTQAINNYLGSVNALTDASKPGHIPTQEFIAKKLLTYLKDPAVNTGPIADVLAGKSNQASLNSKEQEVLKLIQQRIQNLNPRTDADAQSKKDAYGSFRLKKEALSDLVRQDLGSIQNQKLLANGTINAAGDPSSPNLPAVVNFQSKYKEFSKDPVLMQYTGIVGTGNKASIDEHDKAALRKLMTENHLSSLEELEQRRKQLVEMSGAK